MLHFEVLVHQPIQTQGRGCVSVSMGYQYYTIVVLVLRICLHDMRHLSHLHTIFLQVR